MGLIRRARVTVDADALRHNLGKVRAAASNSRVMAVIKANAYGHGMKTVASALVDADAFAVATLGEARELRDAGVNKDLCVLQGASSADELAYAASQNIAPVVHQASQLEKLEQQAASLAEIDVWLKVDTGMHRLGISLEDTTSFYNRLVKLDCVRSVHLMSHFANADLQGDSRNVAQLACFRSATEDLTVQKSMSNSAAILSVPDAHFDWVRPGIMLYGVSPFEGSHGGEYGLQPAMRLSAPLLDIRQLQKGEPVGYGGIQQCPEDMAVGIVGIGYGDGYPRLATKQTPLWINGKLTRVFGRVSMDSLAIDLSGVDAREGDEVVLWGGELPVEMVADSVSTIAYELLCHVGSAVPEC